MLPRTAGCVLGVQQHVGAAEPAQVVRRGQAGLPRTDDDGVERDAGDH